MARPSAQGEMSKENIKAFAAKFDPQPFRLDKATAQDTIFRGLAASGWHTAAMTMRLLVDGEIKLAAGLWVQVRRIPLATSCATRRRAAS
ncbi:MaoC/PaaZ C-terminal domain-containing protein [Mesorhizobium muleiense]|uniref:MaoC/PaaZ C-terminal domain-containing protein n=1 Tax=Mesorhizobium muleiense TaxID=1004279 RepID=UPI003AFB3A25